MTKKHFVAIASEFASLLDEVKTSGERFILQRTVDMLADTFAGFNDEFDRGRFLRACGF